MDQETQTPTFNFSPDQEITARVLYAKTAAHNQQGALRLYGTLMVADQDGIEREARFSCAAWYYYLHDSIIQMADNPEQAYRCFRLLSKDGRDGKVYHDLVGLTNFTEPPNHEEIMESIGLSTGRAKSNGKPPLAAPAPSGRAAAPRRPAAAGDEEM